MFLIDHQPSSWELSTPLASVTLFSAGSPLIPLAHPFCFFRGLILLYSQLNVEVVPLGFHCWLSFLAMLSTLPGKLCDSRNFEFPDVAKITITKKYFIDNQVIPPTKLFFPPESFIYWNFLLLCCQTQNHESHF